jgi:tRNA A-37 threonylcarbamoyl transferase component Bud32
MAVEHSVAKLEAQQEAMASDIHDMKSALSSIADS